VAEVADCIRIGTRNAQNFELLKEVGGTNKPVMLKRGQAMTIDEWLQAAEYVAQRGNSEIILCERGIRTFEPATRNTLDLAGMAVAQYESHLPVIDDPSHAGGKRHLEAAMAKAVRLMPTIRERSTPSDATVAPSARFASFRPSGPRMSPWCTYSGGAVPSAA
jgi:3-deoxy-7-phosphoheptulonate synthase